ncbi:CotH kinase family protein [Mycobacterium sp. ACS4331]|uniref:CotH kinase family protein n=1 Tax=Mycobacterium sp. ACS4331 TaxID=1834121 RepID=UPI0007FF834B|nr:CotH kinase family protein [Mycobacterium sp. ACS4331]OBF28655.1 spore coat protein CotH [Mycobacterium sp. ACS4331]
MTGPQTAAPPPRRLAHRVPVRLRQHWRLLAALVTVSVALAVVFGNTMIRPYITGDITVMTSEITDNITGTVDLFDPDVEHTLVVDITPAEYRTMLSAYEKDGEKKWVTADITIDGTVIADAAVRLKGNSTLMGLRGDGPPGAPGKGGEPEPGGSSAHKPDAPGTPGGPDGVDPMAMFVGADPDDPTSLPLLISFAENAAGRGYQGMTELSVRPGSPVLNEALALSLTAATGQPTQRYTYAAYTINGQTSTRLLLEHPDEAYAESLFDSDGYLYKADAGSSLVFKGTDQSSYSEQFQQINSAEHGNLAPVINFLQWLDHADQPEFDAHLADWVDVDSLARYLATQNLLVNADDMGGPGQNYYLWYDLRTERLSVLSWDLNLAMVGDAATGPDDEVTLPPPPPGLDLPEPPGGFEALFKGNPLKKRFLESKKFTPIRHHAYWQLFDQMYADGRAQRLLDRIVETIPVTDGLSREDLDASAQSLREWIDRRVTALEDLRAQ